MAKVIRLFDYKHKLQKAKDDETKRRQFEHEQRCNALFVRQHSDDDSFDNADEFIFIDKQDS